MTSSTLPAFELLCQLEVDRRSIRRRFIPQRSPSGEVRALLHMDSEAEMAARREHRALSKDIKAMLKDFKISAFGKELAGDSDSPAAADPLDHFTRRG